MIAKKEQHEQEAKIFALRNEAGLQTLRAWLIDRREVINQLWPRTWGDELTRLQGEATQVVKLIRMIDEGPTIKPKVE